MELLELSVCVCHFCGSGHPVTILMQHYFMFLDSRLRGNDGSWGELVPDKDN